MYGYEYKQPRITTQSAGYGNMEKGSVHNIGNTLNYYKNDKLQNVVDRVCG